MPNLSQPVQLDFEHYDRKNGQNILIYDVFGRLVESQPASETQIDLDLNELSLGVYMLRLDYGDSISTHRIVKATR